MFIQAIGYNILINNNSMNNNKNNNNNNINSNNNSFKTFNGRACFEGHFKNAGHSGFLKQSVYVATQTKCKL